MNKEFIPYEQALELKELGFEAPILGGLHEESIFYYEDGKLYYDYRPLYSSTSHDKQLPAPLYQQAFRFFREKKLSDACVCRYQSRDDGGVYYYYVINHDFGIEETRYFKEGFNTYEEAEHACLLKLIELAKQK